MKHSTQLVTRWLLAVLFSASTGACNRSEPGSQKTSTAPTTPAAASALAASPAPLPADAAESPLDMLLAIQTLPDAIAHLKPEMTDTTNDVSPGAVLLATWAAAHLHWSDIAVGRNETSFALVRKDSDAARGKRMCVRGEIVQIEKQELGDKTAFNGLLLSGDAEILSFLAVGSTGDLVEQSWARFCGVVIGTYDYSNSAGGEGHAVSTVGMFDLPENRKAPH